MGRTRKTERSKSNWRRKLNQKEKNNCRKIAKKAKDFKKTPRGLSTRLLIDFLSDTRNFLGVYAQDQLSNFTLSSFPSFLVVNLDSSHSTGSHWISIGLFSNRLEIFDSLGFDILMWPEIPCSLLNFLRKFSVGRKVITNPKIQNSQSKLCGFYCLFYVLARNVMSFKKLKSYFTQNLRNNDKLLIKLFG